jgi:beta-1,4-mannosyltransferase
MEQAVLFLAPALILLFLSPVLIVVAHFRCHSARLAKNLQRRGTSSAAGRSLHVGVVSLSPASQSPRALNHVVALAESGKFTVCLHAYGPCPELGYPEVVSFLPISASLRQKTYSLVRNLVLQTIEVYKSLVMEDATKKYDVVLVNTPPCIPAFLVVLVAARFVHACPVVIDWHNFAYSIMECNGSSKALVAVARTYEWFLGRAAHGHFCVSRAMSNFLANNWGIDSVVLYDRPPKSFRRIDDMEARHALFKSLQNHAGVEPKSGQDETVATVRNADGFAIHRSTRPAVIVSSTSWTPDEDFSLLLKALRTLDKRLSSMQDGQKLSSNDVFCSRVLCIITGRGPMRSSFEKAVSEALMESIDVWFAWLPLEDYPRLLGCADLGISLHTSSSELDLPMKVVDMLGCGLPVLAYRYKCIEELVKYGKTGFLFRDEQELCDQIFGLLFEEKGSLRRQEVAAFISETFSSPSMRWQAGWERDALPLLLKLCAQKPVR